MRKDWHGLLKIIEINCVDKDKNVLWSKQNLYNTFHTKGEQYILTAAFVGGNTSNVYIPSNFYFGLDNRSAISADDTMDTIQYFGSEPSGNGYSRVAVSSYATFEVSISGSHYLAYGPVISFSASGGSWGPVQNMFLATSIDNTGTLISSVALDQPISTMDSGNSINVRMGLSLADCP